MKRYTLAITPRVIATGRLDGVVAEMKETENGPYVLYDDVAAALAEMNGGRAAMQNIAKDFDRVAEGLGTRLLQMFDKKVAHRNELRHSLESGE